MKLEDLLKEMRKEPAHFDIITFTIGLYTNCFRSTLGNHLSLGDETMMLLGRADI